MPTIRDDLEALRLSIPRKPTQGAGRNFVGKVVDRGSFPTTNGRVLLVNPVEVSGDEVEGGAATLAVDEDVGVPVAYVGDYGPDADAPVPPVGSLLIVERVSGRWVNQAVPTRSYLSDLGNIPRRDISAFWEKSRRTPFPPFPIVVYASGAFTLTWDGFTTWQGDDGHAGFRIEFDAATRHATIQATYDGADVSGLTLMSHSLNPWSRGYFVTSGPLHDAEYSSFSLQ